ncbi:hypothetical protein [Williamsoniiplasma lucivorax]|uniref:Uncharacterized protein n=1 Tax=Williamsoniiplasma lucivorax TaxID=209274 RepID=A0A2S5RDN8_9MOLU|nr:hypothetical protein [Williamsoniiplasma lucivorax]PPE05417.1 hypothetical protein ELUCI_v1c05090 [Williamsoniiplasma lucivorax]
MNQDQQNILLKKLEEADKLVFEAKRLIKELPNCNEIKKSIFGKNLWLSYEYLENSIIDLITEMKQPRILTYKDMMDSLEDAKKTILNDPGMVSALKRLANK